MKALWDYDIDELKKTKQGRIFLVERMINYGPGRNQKIKLSDVKKYWPSLHLFKLQKRLFELLIWGKYKNQSENSKSFWMR